MNMEVISYKLPLAFVLEEFSYENILTWCSIHP